MARRYGSSYGGRGGNAGLYTALQHIEAAKRLTEELGGTDEDVKQYFFNLSPSELGDVLDLYQAEHGKVKRAYAEETMPRWRSGSRKMSGEVAGRLFALLPPIMPVAKKFELVKTLWEGKCPRSTKCFYIGPDAEESEIRSLVRAYLEKVVEDYQIPETIAKRFRWLANDDVDLQQELYNYFLQLNREALTDSLDERLSNFLRRIQNCDTEQKTRQLIAVGNHELAIVFDSRVTGISDSPPRPPQAKASSDDSIGCWVAIITAILFALAIANAK